MDLVVLASTTYVHLQGIALVQEKANNSCLVEFNQDHELGAVTVTVRVDVEQCPLTQSDVANETSTGHVVSVSVSRCLIGNITTLICTTHDSMSIGRC